MRINMMHYLKNIFSRGIFYLPNKCFLVNFFSIFFSLVLFAAVLGIFYVLPIRDPAKHFKSSFVFLLCSVLFGVAAITLFFTLHYFGLLA